MAAIISAAIVANIPESAVGSVVEYAFPGEAMEFNICVPVGPAPIAIVWTVYSAVLAKPASAMAELP